MTQHTWIRIEPEEWDLRDEANESLGRVLLIDQSQYNAILTAKYGDILIERSTLEDAKAVVEKYVASVGTIENEKVTRIARCKKSRDAAERVIQARIDEQKASQQELYDIPVYEPGWHAQTVDGAIHILVGDNNERLGFVGPSERPPLWAAFDAKKQLIEVEEFRPELCSSLAEAKTWLDYQVQSRSAKPLPIGSAKEARPSLGWWISGIIFALLLLSAMTFGSL